MLDRLRSWWAGRSRLERLLVAVGVPVAAIAALWSARRDRAAKAEEAAAAGEDAEGGPGTQATEIRGTPGAINVGAPGVATSDLASFTEAFSGEIGSLEDSLAGLEKQFGDTATERAKRDAERQQELEDIRRELEEDEDRVRIPEQPWEPVPGPGTDRPPESPKRRTDKERQTRQEKSKPELEHLRAAVRATGHHPGSVIDPADVLAALRRIGRDPGSVADPADIRLLQKWHANNS